MRLARVILIWASLAAAICVPIAAAAASPLLKWRDAIYIVAGFAGIVALGLLLVQPFRRRLGLRTFRMAHMSLAVVIVVGSVIHGMLVEGTMETMSKATLCALVLVAATKVMADLWARRKRATSGRESIARR